jgi:pimeloyl-ACP methyl ester carboxylesterase
MRRRARRGARHEPARAPGRSRAGRPAAAPAWPLVLVHGARHGGRCWQRVVPLLAAEGHSVFTPSLTGLGERRHAARPEIDIHLHALDLEPMLGMEGLRDAVLVGHSQAGLPLSLLAERVPERIGRLVHPDAFVPEDGRSVLDFIQPGERRTGMRAAARANLQVAPLPLAAFGVTAPEDVGWAQPRLVPQPLATFVQPIRPARGAGHGMPRDDIPGTWPPGGAVGQFAERLRPEPGWSMQALPTGHDATTTPRGRWRGCCSISWRCRPSRWRAPARRPI